MRENKKQILFVYNNFGVGGIAKSLIDALKVIDYSEYDVTLFIRRDDILDLIEQVPENVKIITAVNEVKYKVFENNLRGKIVKLIHDLLIKKHKYLAKQFFIRYKYPLQRKKDRLLFDQDLIWDVAITYSTDEDDPVFVKDCIQAKRKYVFVHQSTPIAKMNIKAMYDFLWVRIFRLDDAAEMNRMHMEYGNTKQEYAPGYRFSISDEEYTFLPCVCGIAGKIRGNVPRITPEMLTEKERKDLLTAAETLAESKSFYYYIDISQADRKYVRQIAEHHLLYPRACRINHIVRRLCIRSQEIGLFEENADRDILHQWAYFISKAADTTEKKYNKLKDGRGDPISEMITEFAKKSRINGFRVVRKTSGTSGRR